MARLDDKEITKRILNSNPGGRGRTKLRWIDGVKHDLRKIGCKNWKMVAQDRRCCQHLLEGRPTPGCCASDDGEEIVVLVIHLSWSTAITWRSEGLFLCPLF